MEALAIVAEKCGVPEIEVFVEADEEAATLPLAVALPQGLAEGAALVLPPIRALAETESDGDCVAEELKQLASVALLLAERMAEEVKWVSLPRGEEDALPEELMLVLGVAGKEGLWEGLPVALPLREERVDALAIVREGEPVALHDRVAHAVLHAESQNDAVGLALTERTEALPLGLPEEHALWVPLRVKEALAVATLLRVDEGLPPTPVEALLDALAAPEALRLLDPLPVLLAAVPLAAGDGVSERLARLALTEFEGSALAESCEAEAESLGAAEVVKAALLEALEELAAVEVNAALFELLRVPVAVVHGEAVKVFELTAVPVACDDCDCFAEPLFANVAEAEAEPVTDTVAERVSRALGEVEELLVALSDGSALLERTPLTVAVPLGLLLKLTKGDLVVEPEARMLPEPCGGEGVAEPLAEAEVHAVME